MTPRTAAVLLLCAPPAAASHTWYGFDTLPDPAVAKLVAFESDLVWTEVEQTDKTNVYLATQFYIGAAGKTHHGGYFGGQFHADGSNAVLFSIWDFNETVKNAWWSEDASPWCKRFGGEGQGAHCDIAVKFEIGLPYRFRMEFSHQNATGDFWNATVTDLKARKEQLIGQIYLGSVPGVGRAGGVLAQSVSFQEYYTGGDFLSAAGWIGPRVDDDRGETYTATRASADCNEPSTVSACIPGYGCGSPYSHTVEGKGIGKNCSQAMWGGGGAPLVGAYPLRTSRPTNA